MFVGSARPVRFTSQRVLVVHTGEVKDRWMPVEVAGGSMDVTAANVRSAAVHGLDGAQRATTTWVAAFFRACRPMAHP